jgi:hypothetical protein
LNKQEWDPRLFALKTIAEQLHRDNPTRPLDMCFMDAFADYKAGAISENLLQFMIDNPGCRVVLDYKDEKWLHAEPTPEDLHEIARRFAGDEEAK